MYKRQRLLHLALEEFGRDALVMYFARGHYRQPLAFSPEALEEAGRAVERLRELGRRLDPDGPDPQGLDDFAERFFDHLADDFNTPAALGVLFEWVSEANRRLDGGEPLGPGRLPEMLHALGMEGVLETGEVAPPEAQALLEEREAARTAKDFARADELRDALAAAGYEVRDTPEGPKLRRLP